MNASENDCITLVTISCLHISFIYYLGQETWGKHIDAVLKTMTYMDQIPKIVLR